MIVKLTYSAELEEVPSEVGKIVDSTVLEMEEVCRDLSSVQNDLTKKEADVKTALSKIEFTMKFIEKLDTKLKDCQSILSGYLSVLEQQNQQEDTKPQVTPQKVVSDETSTKTTAKKKTG